MGTRRFDTRLLALPAETLHEFLLRISRIDRFRGWWDGRSRLPPSLLKRLRKRVEESSAGVTLSMIAGPGAGPPVGRTPGSPPRKRRNEPSPREAGYAALLREVFDGYRGMTFGEERIRRFHADLFRYSPGDRAHRGNYRPLSGGPADRPGPRPDSPALRPPDPALAAAEMASLAGWTARNLESGPYHPLLVLPSFLLEFLAIRPFAAGNGRTSRILANYLLLRCGYSYVPYRSLDKILEARRIEYLLALRRSQAFRNLPRPDISSFLRVFLQALEAQADGLREIASGIPEPDRLSANQQAVLELLDRHGEVTNRDIRRELGIPRDTVKQVLGRLLELSRIRRNGAGRATRYRNVPPLPESARSSGSGGEVADRPLPRGIGVQLQGLSPVGHGKVDHADDG